MGRSLKENDQLAEWNLAIADHLENGSTEQGFHDLIASVLTFDEMLIFEYANGSATSIFHTVSDRRKKFLVDDYVLGPFLLDPFYTQTLSCRHTKFMVMRDVSPGHFHKSEFYRRHYHLTGIADEIGIAFEINKDRSTVVSLTRNKNQPRFGAREKNIFRHATPVLAVLGRKLWKQTETHDRASMSDRQENAFDNFGKDVLSKREVEIASLILQGHSSISAGKLLNISPGTVKNHRKNLYFKLNISSQAELFNKFIHHISKKDEDRNEAVA